MWPVSLQSNKEVHLLGAWPERISSRVGHTTWSPHIVRLMSELCKHFCDTPPTAIVIQRGARCHIKPTNITLGIKCKAGTTALAMPSEQGWTDLLVEPATGLTEFVALIGQAQETLHPASKKTISNQGFCLRF